MNEIGYRIKQRREELQITQDELAKRMGSDSRHQLLGIFIENTA